MNILATPKGSRIKIGFNLQDVIIQWKNPDNLLCRLVVAAFLMLWLSKWVESEISIALNLWTIFQQKLPVNSSQIFDFFIWSAFGAYALAFLYNSFRGAGDAQLVLSPHGLTYNPGRLSTIHSLLQISQQTNNFINIFSEEKTSLNDPFLQKTQKKSIFLRMFTNGKMISVTKQDVSNLQLSYTGNKSTVIFNIRGQRIEVGEYLTGLENEWLFNTLENWLYPAS